VRTTLGLLFLFAGALASCTMPAKIVNHAPANASSMTVHVIRLRPGEDVKRSLEGYVKTNDIEAAVILSCVGSLDVASLRFANRPTATTVPGKLEITSLVGTLAKSSGSHVHMTVADGDGIARGGHLMDGSLVYTTAEIAIGELPSVRFTREEDSTYGYHELVVHPRL
jgi:predicted DNA-binding protein with PD1-like motif